MNKLIDNLENEFMDATEKYLKALDAVHRCPQYEGEEIEYLGSEFRIASQYLDQVKQSLLEAKAANPNRFIKSSFTLSLLWVAKFYRCITDSYKKNCRQDISAWRFSARTYQLYRHYLGLSTIYSTIGSPNSYRWFRHHHA